MPLPVTLPVPVPGALPVDLPLVAAVEAQHPCLTSILRRVGVSLLVAVIMPAALFYVTLQAFGITAAVIAAVVWTWSAIVWRAVTKRPMSGLLILTVSVLTIRTVFTLSTGNTYVYFLQPVVSDGLIACMFLVSLVTATPVVSRLAADFYPMNERVADLPRVRRRFWRLTLMWGCVCLLRGAVGFWLLQSLSVSHFVLVNSISITSMTMLAVAVTIWASTVVLRRESMLAPAAA